MPRHFQPVILYKDQQSFSLPTEKKQQIHNMLRTNGRIWTALFYSSPIKTKNQAPSSSNAVNKGYQQRHPRHQRISSQDSILSSAATGQCPTPPESNDLPLDYRSPYFDEDDSHGDNDSRVDKEKYMEVSNQATIDNNKRSRKQKSFIFNHHPSLVPTSPVLSSSSSVSSSSSPPITPVISAATARKRRGNLPKTITCLLKEWLIIHADHPYPSDDEKSHLQRETNLTINQISNWFINARRRLLPYLINGTRSTSAIDHHYHQAQQKGSNGKRKQQGMYRERYVG